MNIINTIKDPIKDELQEFEERFKFAMKSSAPLLDKITNYIVKSKGKQIRPMFVFLSAKICGKVNDSTYSAAILIELLHTATLVHDDVVDDSHLRRGFFSINALWKNKIAVLVGDYLLSKGLLYALDKDEHKILKIVSDAVKKMSEGELIQIEKARSLDITEQIYYDIIKRKTASLISACCAAGAASTTTDEEVIKKMHLLGENIGISFQIKDDLFDYGSNGKIGKPTVIDIKEKKLTLPLIYAFNNTSKSEKRRVMNIIKNHNEDFRKVSEVIAFVRRSGGIEYAKSKMFEYHDKAVEILKELPDNQAKESLKELIHYTVNRDK